MVAGIICECNPLHAGHIYLMEEARRAGAETIVCLMSGCFVQRGEAAVADPYARAEILLRAGADAVFELPYPFSSASAEFFGAAGVNILSRLGVDTLWFGSECGDIALLQQLADLADSPAFSECYTKALDGNNGTASAYFDALRMLYGKEIPCSPNDILAISYLRALNKYRSCMIPYTVKRQGSGYGEKTLSEEGFPSATALRRAWCETGLETIRGKLPADCFAILQHQEEIGRAPASLQNAESLVLGCFRLRSETSLADICGLEGGLAQRMCRMASHADSLQSFLALSATKKYTGARLRRGILFALTDITDADLRRMPDFVRLLGANGKGRAFLSAVRKSSEISIVTKQSDIPREAEYQLAMEEKERTLYTLCLPEKEDIKHLLTRTALIL